MRTGTAIAGERGTATSGTKGEAIVGPFGTATVGDWGRATAGEGGTATAGEEGTCRAGEGGVISILYWDPQRKRHLRLVAEVGITPGIEPGKFYAVRDGRFVPAPE